MTFYSLTLGTLPDTLAICMLDVNAAFPGWATAGGFFSITWTRRRSAGWAFLERQEGRAIHA
jgi:hypothetical protein